MSARRAPALGLANHFLGGLGTRLSTPLCRGSGEPSDAPSGARVECPTCGRTIEVVQLPKRRKA